VELGLNPDLAIDAIAAEYAAKGRVRIASFMAEPGVRALHGAIVQRKDWRTLFIGAAGVSELSRADREAMDAAATQAFDQQIHERACLGFQYRYEGLRIPAAGEARSDDALGTFADFMASPMLLDLLGRVIGRADIAFSEGQATAYGPATS
jgi:hypothetical protein